MPTYVYGCENDHRIQRAHSIDEDPVVTCSECGKLMHRVPQPFRFYMNPADVLLDYTDKGFSNYLRKREIRKAYANKQRT